MARLLDGSQRLDSSTTPITAVPLSMVSRGRHDDDRVDDHCLMQLQNSGASGSWFRFGSSPSATSIQLTVLDGGAGLGAVTSASPALDTWFAGCAVARSSTDISCFLDGGNEGTDTSPATTPSGIDSISLGIEGDSSPSDNWEGGLAESCLYNDDLLDDEVAALVNWSPLCVRPQNLAAYWPLGGLYGENDNDLLGGYDMTLTGSSAFEDHPTNVIYPSDPLLIIPVVAGIIGSSATTNAPDTQAASGQLTNVGSSATTNVADTQVATGVVGIVGAAASTNNPDAQAAAGQLTNSGNAATINADDAQAASGELLVIGASNTINADDMQSASGVVGLAIVGASTTTNADDDQSAAGILSNIGSSTPVNANDAQAASGVVSSAGITGTSITINAADIQTAVGVLSNVGIISVINNHDVQAANGLIGVPPNDVTFIRLTDRYSLIRTTGSFTMNRTTNDFTLIRNTG